MYDETFLLKQLTKNYLYDIKIKDDLIIPVWYKKGNKFKIELYERHIIINSKNITKKDILNYMDESMIHRLYYLKKKDVSYCLNPYDFNKECMKICTKYSKKLGLKTIPQIKYIKSSRYNGYCYSKKLIHLNMDLIYEPKYMIKKTICHELVHELKGFKHHKYTFWDKLEWLMDEKTD